MDVRVISSSRHSVALEFAVEMVEHVPGGQIGFTGSIGDAGITEQAPRTHRVAHTALVRSEGKTVEQVVAEGLDHVAPLFRIDLGRDLSGEDYEPELPEEEILSVEVTSSRMVFSLKQGESSTATLGCSGITNYGRVVDISGEASFSPSREVPISASEVPLLIEISASARGMDSEARNITVLTEEEEKEEPQLSPEELVAIENQARIADLEQLVADMAMLILGGEEPTE
jgi:hypothetical protein